MANTPQYHDQLIKLIAYLTLDDQTKVLEALAFAMVAHEGQLRKSGEPYVEHALETTKELAGMRMDATCLIAGLLHDVPEDTPVTLEQIKTKFGAEVAQLVDGVTKLGRVRLRNKEEQQARNLRKMFLAMAEDVRVIIIKLCDRLHNMKTISVLPRNKQKGIAAETLEIYAPLANRLGMADIRWQLEDLSFRCMQPKMYNTIEKQLRATKSQRDAKLKLYIKHLQDELAKAKITARVMGRAKHLYSIYMNVYVKNKEASIEDLLDSIGLRLIVNDVKDCYQALGLVHRIWRPIVGRFKDYIAIPKSNGYQSLHTGVISDDGTKLEIQLRTEEMDFTAEYGMAAHWRYKEEMSELDATVQDRMDWIHQLIDWQKEFRTAFDFVESLKLDLFEDQIFVFTPRGDVIDLPKGATIVDFAYRVHTELGNNALGGKVNSRMVPLNFQLKNGDIVEVLKSTHRRGPSRDWLEFVKTNVARGRIRAWFKRQQHNDNVQSGKKRLQAELHKINRTKFEDITKNSWEHIAKDLNYPNAEDLFAALGYGALNVSQILGKLVKDHPLLSPSTQVPHAVRKTDQLRQLKPLAKILGTGDLLVKMAPCCQPIPGDKIVGYISRGKGITVHRLNCKNIIKERRAEPERVIPLSWEQDQKEAYEVTLQLTARDHTGLIKDVINTISDQQLFVTSMEGHSDADKGVFTSKISMRVYDLLELINVIHSLEHMPGMISVERKY